VPNSEIILIGAGGHARACIDVIEQEANYKIAGLIEQHKNSIGDVHLGYKVLASDDSLANLYKQYRYAIIVIGQLKTANARIEKFNLLKSIGFEFPIIISPSAYVSPHASIGEGTIVMHGATINSGAVIGKNCIVNSKSLIEHDSKVDDHCHISTCAILNGGVEVAEGSFIGSGAILKQGIKIGSQCVIDMGCIVKVDFADSTSLLVNG